MELIERYIRSHILSAMFSVLLVIVGLDLLAAFIAELEELKGDYQKLEAVTYVLTTVPSRAYELVPVAALVGCLIGLGAMANNSELIVIRAAGVSVGQVVWAVLKPTLVIAVLTVLLGEYVVPATEQYAQSKKSVAMGRDRVIKTKSGIWHREGNEFVRINAVEADGTLHGITRYRFDNERKLIAAAVSKSASFENDHWLVQDTFTTRLGEDQTRVEYEAEQNWFIQLTPESISVVILKPEYMSLSELYQYKRYLDDQGLNTLKYAIAFWQKLFQPAIMVAMIIIAMSFIFGPLRSVTVGLRVVVGIVVGLGFQQCQDLFNYAAIVYNFNPFIAVVLPVLLCFLAGAILLNRVR